MSSSVMEAMCSWYTSGFYASHLLVTYVASTSGNSKPAPLLQTHLLELIDAESKAR